MSVSEQLTVAVVVLNYQAADTTLECVRAVQESVGVNVRVIVVDNCSGDDSLVKLRAALAGVTILAHDRNLGYGDGNNIGIREAAHLNAKYAWIVTPDVKVQPTTLSVLVRHMETHTRLGICGPVIRAGDLYISGSLVKRHWGYFPYHIVHDSPKSKWPESIHTDYIDGCAILLRMAMVQAIGLLRDDFFLYFDETEYCLRAADQGWVVEICGQAQVTTRPITEERNNREYFMVRNCIALARTKHKYVLRAVVRAALMPCLQLALFRPMRFVHEVKVHLWGIWAGLRMPLREPPRLDGRRLPEAKLPTKLSR